MSTQGWEAELERAYVVHKARRLHDNKTMFERRLEVPAPAYLRTRLEEGKPMPRVQIQRDGWSMMADTASRLCLQVYRMHSLFNSLLWRYGSGEAWVGSMTEEVGSIRMEEGWAVDEEGATLTYAVYDLPSDLYIELLEGFHK
jgi:hypothetical protein